jgi:hypothetical protein
MKHFIALSLALACAAPALAHSAKNPASKFTDAEALAITWVAEAGWSNVADHEAMGHVFLRISERRGWRLKTTLTAYSKGLWHGSRSRAAWLLELGAQCSKPKSWPHSEGLWRAYHHKCKDVFARAANFLKDTPIDNCGADHFGSEQDNPHPNLERIDCGDTKQVYYRRKKKAD